MQCAARPGNNRVTPGDIVDIAVAVIALLSGGLAAVLSYRATRTTAKADTMAVQVEAYDELVRNLRDENSRLRADLVTTEQRCRDCRDEVGELLSDLAGLKAVVTDEMARAAAQTVLDAHADDEEAELDEIRQYLRNLRWEDNP